MRKILIIAGSRGDYGFIKPIIEKIKQNDNLSYETLVTNMHLISKFGNSIDEFKEDDITVDYKIYNTLDGYNNITMAKSLGIFLLQIPEILEKSKPDIILLSGDRGEQLMSAIAGSHMNIPVAHIQAGEKSGNIDGHIRHSITKLSHIHLCSNQDAYDRVKNLGEEEFRIFNTGAPQLDELFNSEFIIENILDILKIPRNKDIFLIINHSISEESEESEEQMKILLDSVDTFESLKIIIMPNSDAGNLKIRKVIESEKKKNYYIFYNLDRKKFLSIMNLSKIIIGNSSCGLIESPVFKKPAVNIGRRQIGRFSGKNVINVENYEKEGIIDAIKLCLSKEFSEKIKNIESVYGDGKSSDRIVNILTKIKLNTKLLNKNITY